MPRVPVRRAPEVLPRGERSCAETGGDREQEMHDPDIFAPLPSSSTELWYQNIQDSESRLSRAASQERGHWSDMPYVPFGLAITMVIGLGLPTTGVPDRGPKRESPAGRPRRPWARSPVPAPLRLCGCPRAAGRHRGSIHRGARAVRRTPSAPRGIAAVSSPWPHRRGTGALPFLERSSFWCVTPGAKRRLLSGGLTLRPPWPSPSRGLPVLRAQLPLRPAPCGRGWMPPAHRRAVSRARHIVLDVDLLLRGSALTSDLPSRRPAAEGVAGESPSPTSRAQHHLLSSRAWAEVCVPRHLHRR